MCLLGLFKIALVLTFIVTACITFHEILRPRQPRGQAIATAVAIVSGQRS
jgi:hypothetical protein